VSSSTLWTANAIRPGTRRFSRCVVLESHAITALQQLGHQAVAVDLPGHGARVDDEETLINRRDAIVSVLRAGDDVTLAADAAPNLVSHIVYLAAALPREGRTVRFILCLLIPQ